LAVYTTISKVKNSAQILSYQPKVVHVHGARIVLFLI
jgi:hypothetical protein